MGTRTTRLMIVVLALLVVTCTFRSVSHAQPQIYGHCVTGTAKNTAKAHIVLVHGFGVGAWCWYKVIPILQEFGFEVTALDMASCGKDKTIADTITTAAEYIKPVTDFLDSLTTSQVILVGHAFGCNAVTRLSESHSSKISKTVCISGLEPKNNESGEDWIAEFSRLGFSDPEIVVGNYNSPTDPTQITSESVVGEVARAFIRSPIQDVTLVRLLRTPIPYAAANERILLTLAKHGSVRRFYIAVEEDEEIPFEIQMALMQRNPPECHFILKNGHHGCMFSVPLELSAMLNHISTL